MVTKEILRVRVIRVVKVANDRVYAMLKNIRDMGVVVQAGGER